MRKLKRDRRVLPNIGNAYRRGIDDHPESLFHTVPQYEYAIAFSSLRNFIAQMELQADVRPFGRGVGVA